LIVPSDSQLARIRNRPQRTRLWLGIYEPRLVVSAQLNAGNDKSAVDLDVTYITGAPEDIKPDMTAYIGSTAGGQEFGRIRVRSASAGQIDVSENSIKWQENWYITVVEFYEPWSIFPRIVLDGNNVPVFYKDYDIAYVEQNQYLDPIVVMGPHHAGFLATGSHSVFYSSIGSFDPTPDTTDLLLTGSTYSWRFGDSGFVDPTGTTDQNPGWVTYHSGGFYTTDLEITNVHGESFTGHRHISIYDRPGEGPERPYIKWGLNAIDGSRDEGGYRTRIWLREEVGFSKVKDGSLVVIFSDDWQGSAEGAIGGNAENRDSIFFVGYIDRGTISIDSETNRLEFQASSIAGVMREVSNYSVSLESEKTAQTWYQMRNMTVDRAVIHLLRWQSTVLALSDFYQTGDTLQVQYADFDRGSLYDTANQFLGSTIAAQMVGDRQGALYCEVDLNLIPTGSSRLDYLTALDVERRDWRSSLRFDFVPNSPMAYVEMGGIAYSGPQTGTTNAYLAGAPGDAQLWRGNIERGSGLVLSGQDQLNVLTANMLALANSEFPDVEVPLAGDYRFIDIAPQRRITLTLEEDETHRGFVWDQKYFIPRSMSFHYDPTRQSLMTDLTVKEETWAIESGEADTIIIPVDPPYTNYKLPEWSIEFPPFLPLDPLIPPVEGPPTSGNTVYVLYANVLARSRNFFSLTDPNWETVTVPADLAESSTFSLFRLNPTDPRNTAYLISEYSGDYTIYRTYNLDAAVPIWELIFSATDSQTHLGASAMLSHMGIWLNGSVITVGGAGGKDCLPGNQCPKFIRSANGGDTWTESHSGAWQSAILGLPMLVQVPFFGAGTMYASRSGEGRLWKSIDVGINFVQKYYDDPVFANSNPHPSGETIYATGNVVFGVPGNRELKVSETGGDNWVSLPLQHRGNYMAPYGEGSVPGDRSDNFHYHPTADAHYGMVAGGGVSTFAVFDNSWIPLWDFSGEIFPYMLHYGNSSLHYALGNAADGRIIGSNDGGSTWYNKDGDFATAVLAWALTGDKMSVQPVHNA